MNKLSDFIQQLEMPSQSNIMEALIDNKSSQKLNKTHTSTLKKLARQIFLSKK